MKAPQAKLHPKSVMCKLLITAQLIIGLNVRRKIMTIITNNDTVCSYMCARSRYTVFSVFIYVIKTQWMTATVPLAGHAH